MKRRIARRLWREMLLGKLMWQKIEASAQMRGADHGQKARHASFALWSISSCQRDDARRGVCGTSLESFSDNCVTYSQPVRTTSIANGMAVLVPPPQWGHGCSTVFT